MKELELRITTTSYSERIFSIRSSPQSPIFVGTIDLNRVLEFEREETHDFSTGEYTIFYAGIRWNTSVELHRPKTGI